MHTSLLNCVAHPQARELTSKARAQPLPQHMPHGLPSLAGCHYIMGCGPRQNTNSDTSEHGHKLIPCREWSRVHTYMVRLYTCAGAHLARGVLIIWACVVAAAGVGVVRHGPPVWRQTARHRSSPSLHGQDFRRCPQLCCCTQDPGAAGCTAGLGGVMMALCYMACDLSRVLPGSVSYFED